ncbi:MAG: tetratricopeptide repeat protein [Planctomyces sp.]
MSEQPVRPVRNRGEDVYGSRSFPTFLQVLNPSYAIQFLYGMVECWFFSRNYFSVLVALPFLVFAAGGAGCYWWVKHSSPTEVLRRYEDTYNAAVTSENIQIQETCLRALCNLQPGDYQYQMRLGQFLVRSGRKAEGLQQIAALAPDNLIGYPEARIWLVQQSLTAEPIQRLSKEQIEQQLLKAIEAAPEYGLAHELLAGFYITTNELSLAEKHLSIASRNRPELNLDIAILKRENQRPTEDVDAAARKAVTELSNLLEKDRANSAVRISLARAWILLQDFNSAREVLVSGLNQKPEDISLRAALADLSITVAEQRLGATPLNRDGCIPLVLEAIRLNPGNRQAVQLLTNLRSLGAAIEPTQWQAATDHWQQQVQKEPENMDARLLLCQLQFLGGLNAEAVETMRPVAQARPELRVSLARLMLEAGMAADGEKMLMDLIQECDTKLADKPGDSLVLIERAESLLLLKRPRDSKLSLAQKVAGLPKNLSSLEESVLQLYARACLEEFDSMTGYSSAALVKVRKAEDIDFGDADGEEMLKLLQEASRSERSLLSAVERLSRLSLSPHPEALMAEEATKQLRLNGQTGVLALNLLGMHALLMKRYDRAIGWLEQANALSRSRDPMVLNNLALALVRGRPEEKGRALELSEQALALIPDNPEALGTHGEINVQLERWDAALKDLVRSVQYQKNNPEIHQLLETTYRALNDDKMADVHKRLAEELATEFEDGSG